MYQKGLLRPDGQTLPANQNFNITKVKNQYTFCELLRLSPEAQADTACGGCFFYNGIGLRLNIDTLLNLDPRIALRLSEDDSAR